MAPTTAVRPTRSVRAPLAILMSMWLALAGCGRDANKGGTQVAAKVNAGEITVHQVNHVLERSGALRSAPAATLKQEALDALVDQQLAADKALELELDRSPDVVIAMQASRREILARSYLERVSASVPAPTDAEARRYFAEHPQLFADRRLYTLQEVVLPLGSGAVASVRDLLVAGRALDEIALWLRAKGLAFSGGMVTRPAEQIPLDLLERLHSAKAGEVLIVEAPQQSESVMRVAAAIAAPVDEGQALPRIRSFLANRRTADAVTQEIARLRQGAQIAYLGEFAAGPVGPAATAAPAVQSGGAVPLGSGVAGLR